MRRMPLRAAVLVLAFALTACTPSSSPETPSPTETTASESETPIESDIPSETASEEPTTEGTDGAGDGEYTPANMTTQSDTFGEIAGGDLVMESVELVSSDRVEITLTGEDTPGWLAEYPDDPRTEGKGEPVELENPYVFGLYLAGFTYPESEWTLGNLGPDLFVDPPFEGTTAVFIGRPSAQDYRVTVEPGTVTIEFRSQ